MCGVRIYLYVFCTTVLMFCQVAAEHSFVVEPADTEAIEGTSVQLQCKAVINMKDSDSYRIYWQFNNSRIIEKTDKGYTIREDRTSARDSDKFYFTSNFTIIRASHTAAGLYRCHLYDPDPNHLQSPSRNARVAIISSPKPSLRLEPVNVNVIEGRRGVIFECGIKDRDVNTMSVQWMKDNQVISDDQVIRDSVTYDRYSIISDDIETFNLSIKQVTRSDSGIYSCRVYHKTSNAVILRSRDAMLHVIYAPDDIYPICSPRKAANYSAGDSLTTDCVTKGGNGPINLTWLRNGEEINETRTGDEITSNSTTGYNVIFRNTWILTPDDNGVNITCVLKGEAISNKQRQCVIGPLNVYSEPIVTIQPAEIQVLLGQRITFTCSVRANRPIGKYLWLLNDRQLNNSDSILTIGWDDIAEHITSTETQVNVTCGPEKMASATAVLSVTPTTTQQESKSVVSRVIIYIVVGILCLLLGTVVIFCVVFRYLKRKRNPDSQDESENSKEAPSDGAITRQVNEHMNSDTTVNNVNPKGIVVHYDAICQLSEPSTHVNTDTVYSTDFISRSGEYGDYIESRCLNYEIPDGRQDDHSYQALTHPSKGVYTSLGYVLTDERQDDHGYQALTHPSNGVYTSLEK